MTNAVGIDRVLEQLDAIHPSGWQNRKHTYTAQLDIGYTILSLSLTKATLYSQQNDTVLGNLYKKLDLDIPHQITLPTYVYLELAFPKNVGVRIQFSEPYSTLDHQSLGCLYDSIKDKVYGYNDCVERRRNTPLSIFPAD